MHSKKIHHKGQGCRISFSPNVIVDKGGKSDRTTGPTVKHVIAAAGIDNEYEKEYEFPNTDNVQDMLMQAERDFQGYVDGPDEPDKLNQILEDNGYEDTDEEE